MQRSKLVGLTLTALAAVMALVAYIISDGVTTNFTDVAPTLTAITEFQKTPTVIFTPSPIITVKPTIDFGPTPTQLPTNTHTPAVFTPVATTPTVSTQYPDCTSTYWCILSAHSFYLVTVSKLWVRTAPERIGVCSDVNANTPTLNNCYTWFGLNNRILVQCILTKANGEIWFSGGRCDADLKGSLWFAYSVDGMKTTYLKLDENQ